MSPTAPFRLEGQGPELHLTLLGEGQILIGRDYACHVRLPHRSVSRRHLILHLRKRHAWLRDLSSLNGTWLNKQRVRGLRYLSDGDALQISRHVLLILHIAHPPPPPPPMPYLPNPSASNQTIHLPSGW